MPVYEYFCPGCSRELEILRPIQSGGEYSDCPVCGGRAWRLVSGFGSKTGSYLQPSGMPFRAESGRQVSTSEIVATVTKSDVDLGSPADDRRASSAVEMSWLLESQPNGSNIWFMQDWGIASILRYLRDDSDEKPPERTRYLDEVLPVIAAEAGPTVARAEPWAAHPSGEPAAAARPQGQAAGALGHHWLPVSYFGWFMLLVACIAAIVVPLVWILAVAA